MSPDITVCPECGSDVYDNRAKNLQRKALGKSMMPDFACQNGCGWVKWPKKESTAPVAQQVSGYNRQPRFGNQGSVPKVRDFDAEAEGKCRHGFLLEAFKRGDKLTPKLIEEINLWTAVSMTGKLPATQEVLEPVE